MLNRVMENRLKEIRLSRRPRMSQRKLADLVGVSYNTVHRDETLPSFDPSKLAKYAKALGVTESEILILDSDEKTGVASLPKVSKEKPILGIENIKGDTVPVIDLETGQEISRAYRHENQLGYVKAYAFHVQTSIMHPRYKQGELAYANADQPPMIGQDCLVKTKDKRSILSEYGGSAGGRVILQQFKPLKKTSIKLDQIEAIHAVVGRA